MSSCQQIASVKCTKFKHQSYVLAVKLKDERQLFINKTNSEFAEIQAKLKENAKDHKDVISIPHLQVSGIKWFETKKDEKRKKLVDDFCQQILKLPENVKQNAGVSDFFLSGASESEDGQQKGDRRSSTSSNSGMLQNQNSLVRQSTVTNEQMGGESTYEDISLISTVNEPLRQPTISNAVAQPTLPPRTPDELPNDLYAKPLKKHSAPADEQQLKKPASPTNVSAAKDESNLYSEIGPTEIKPTENSVANSTVVANNDDESEEYANSAEMMKITNHHQPVTKVGTGSSVRDKEFNSARPAPRPNDSTNHQLSGADDDHPMMSIPPMPQFSAPTLSDIDVADYPEVPADVPATDSNDLQVMALADYTSSSDNVLSFIKGTIGTVIVQSDSDWWCVKLSTNHGWVPSEYWSILNQGDCASLSTKGGATWFVGKLSRSECEELLMKHGKQRDFVVRESTTLGHYAMSVKNDDKVHHFPIELTPDRKYNIGRHDFKSVTNVISYYKKNPLFYSESGAAVTLGSPLVILRQ